MLKTAESIGIPLDAILQYVSELQAYNAGVETRLGVVVDVLQHFDEGVQTSVAKMMAKAQEANVKQLDERKKAEEEFLRTHPEYKQQMPQGQAPQGGGGIGGFVGSMLQNPAQIAEMAKAFGFGGGGPSFFGAEFEEAAKKGMMDSMLGDMALGKTIRLSATEALGKTIGKGIAESITKVVVPPG
jgi:hypothetical protein